LHVDKNQAENDHCEIAREKIKRERKHRKERIQSTKGNSEQGRERESPLRQNYAKSR